jgi:hypothetical protein
MAANDSASQTGTDLIATNVLATVNGTAVTGIEVQRSKVGYGVDGDYRDVSTGYPLPAATPSVTVTGTITAANTTPDTGAGTAGSSVVLTVPDNHTSWAAQLTGTFSAGTTLTFQASMDGTTWFYTNVRRNPNTVGLNELQSLTSTDVVGGAAPAGGNPSLWKGTVGAMTYVRVTATSYTGADSVAVRLTSSAGVSGVFLLAAIPQPENTTSTVTSVAASATSVTLITANVNRKGLILHNGSSSATAYVRLGATAATNAGGGHTFDMGPSIMWEAPFNYAGEVRAVWATATGFMNITEII